MQDSPKQSINIFDPSYAYTSGHHKNLNNSIVNSFAKKSTKTIIWCGCKIPDSPEIKTIFQDVGYFADRKWWTMPVSIRLANKIKNQMLGSELSEKKTRTWLAHSLLPFQLLGFALFLKTQPKSNIFISIMFDPSEILERLPESEQKRAQSISAYAWLELSRVCKRKNHNLRLGSASLHTTQRHHNILNQAHLPLPQLHPAFCGAGWQEPTVEASANCCNVLLHWGDLKSDKGLQESLFVIKSLVDGWRPRVPCHFLFHSYSHREFEEKDKRILEHAQQKLGDLFTWIDKYQSEKQMMTLLSKCEIALLAYNQVAYAHRTSGILWCYTAARFSINQSATAIGYGNNWLQSETKAFGMCWVEINNIDNLLAAIDDSLRFSTKTSQQWSTYSENILKNSYANHISELLLN